MEMRALRVTYCVLVCCNIWQVLATQQFSTLREHSLPTQLPSTRITKC